MKSLRDKRQEEFANAWLKDGMFSILNLCPRFGKIYTAINALEKLDSDISILIAYPDKEIEKSWKNDIKKRKYKNKNITYTTHLSLHKYEKDVFDLIIIDEIHLLSEAQIEVTKNLLILNRKVMGLTGTMTNYTEKNLLFELGLKVSARYPFELGIKERVIVDYQITVIQVPLDDTKMGMFKNPKRTEKAQFKALSWVINDKQRYGENTMFLRLNRMRIIQNSESKRLKTIEILQKNKHLRALVFCGTTKIADNLGIPSFHSKSKDKEVLKRFSDGGGENHLAVVKIGNTGVTYKPLNFVLVNYFDSNAENFAQKINRCMGMEYDNPDKKAHIYVICSTELTEIVWLRKALEFFDKSKIKYV